MIEINRIAFIINGARPLKKNTQNIIDACEADGDFQVSFFKTSREKEAIDLATKLSMKGIDLIVAIGGDGTVNEVMNGIMKSDKRPLIAIIPNGTGNDFYRSAFQNKSSGDFISALKNPKTMPLDVGCIQSTHGQHFS